MLGPERYRAGLRGDGDLAAVGVPGEHDVRALRDEGVQHPTVGRVRDADGDGGGTGLVLGPGDLGAHLVDVGRQQIETVPAAVRVGGAEELEA